MTEAPQHGPEWDGRRCSNRCWFAYYGWVGSSSPWCVKCGRANPHYDPTRDVASALDDTTDSAAEAVSSDDQPS